MLSLYSIFSNYYYFIIPLQIIAILHALKTERRQSLYLLIFLPLIGVLIYFVTEILPEIRRGVFTANLQRYLFPNQKINEWTRRVQVADSVTNILGLSAAYADQGHFEKAISLAQSCLKGLYLDDPAIHLQLARYYFHNGQYAESLSHFDTIRAISKINYGVMEDDLMYVRAQEGTGLAELAEAGYKLVIRNHHSLEARYYYGQFLKAQFRNAEAKEQFQAIRTEIKLPPGYLKRRYVRWSRKAMKELLSLK
jgi:hypothetical protein